MSCWITSTSCVNVCKSACNLVISTEGETDGEITEEGVAVEGVTVEGVIIACDDTDNVELESYNDHTH